MELLVADNGSTDVASELAASCGVDTPDSGDNVGFAAGCNLAARPATGEVLILVNPGAVVEAGAHEAMRAAGVTLAWVPSGRRP